MYEVSFKTSFLVSGELASMSELLGKLAEMLEQCGGEVTFEDFSISNALSVDDQPFDRTRGMAQHPIQKLGLGARTHNSLKRADIDTIGDLCALSIEDIRHIPSLGQGGLFEVLDAMALKGISLRPIRQ